MARDALLLASNETCIKELPMPEQCPDTLDELLSLSKSFATHFEATGYHQSYWYPRVSECAIVAATL